ncbi:hypothetical protein ACWC0A_37860 [Streptomyces scopuliridis]
MLLYPFHLPPADTLSNLQLDGVDCVYCDFVHDEPMKPVGRIRGCLLFAHVGCAEENRIEP